MFVFVMYAEFVYCEVATDNCLYFSDKIHDSEG
jgi:hypothetical protein